MCVTDLPGPRAAGGGDEQPRALQVLQGGLSLGGQAPQPPGNTRHPLITLVFLLPLS